MHKLEEIRRHGRAEEGADVTYPCIMRLVKEEEMALSSTSFMVSADITGSGATYSATWAGGQQIGTVVQVYRKRYVIYTDECKEKRLMIHLSMWASTPASRLLACFLSTSLASYSMGYSGLNEMSVHNGLWAEESDRFIRVETQNRWFSYNETVTMESVTQAVSNLALQFGEEDADPGAMSHPFGVALLFGRDDEKGPQLFHMDPSGTFVQCEA
ncbi:hypothetical protein ACRRTK_005883 [Alexandromys fortis]